MFLKAMILKLTERVDRMEKTVDIRIGNLLLHKMLLHLKFVVAYLLSCLFKTDLLDESQTKLSSDLLDSRQCVSQIQVFM